MQAIQTNVRRADAFLALLLLTDALLIIGHVVFMVMHLVVWDTPGRFDNIPSNFSIVAERGFAETFQYFKAFWLILMFVWLVVKHRELGYLVWAAAFLYLGIDDLMEIHEEVGNSIAIRYDYPELLGQRPRDLGEWTVLAIAGGVTLVLLAVAYATGSHTFRRVSRSLVGLVGLFAIFGIVVDALHIVALDRSAGAIFGLIEDGGELLILSLITWYVWCLIISPQFTYEDSHAPTTAQARPARRVKV